MLNYSDLYLIGFNFVAFLNVFQIKMFDAIVFLAFVLTFPT